jgi:hypothetical protein
MWRNTKRKTGIKGRKIGERKTGKRKTEEIREVCRC